MLRLCRLCYDCVQLARSESGKETALAAKLARLGTSDSVPSTSTSEICSPTPANVRIVSSVDTSLSALANLSEIVRRLLPQLQHDIETSVFDGWSAPARTDSGSVSFTGDLRALGACLRDDETQVLFRTSGMLAALCGAVKGVLALVGGTSSAATATDTVGDETSAPARWALYGGNVQAAMLTLAAAIENPMNCEQARTNGLLKTVVGMCALHPSPELEPNPDALSGGAVKAPTSVPTSTTSLPLPYGVLSALLAFVEVRTSGSWIA